MHSMCRRHAQFSLRQYSEQCSTLENTMKNAVYLTIPFQYWQTTKEGTRPLDRQVPILTVQTWQIMPSCNHAAWSAGDSGIETYQQDPYELILKLIYHLTLLTAELNNRKLTTAKNQNFTFCIKPSTQKVPSILHRMQMTSSSKKPIIDKCLVATTHFWQTSDNSRLKCSLHRNCHCCVHSKMI